MAANAAAKKGVSYLPKRTSRYGNRVTQGIRNFQANVFKKSRRREQAAYNKIMAKKGNVAPQVSSVNNNSALMQMEKAASYIEDLGLRRPLLKYCY